MKRKGYYICQYCGSDFKDSNPLLDHLRRCSMNYQNFSPKVITNAEPQAQLAERDKDMAELHNTLHERDKTILEQQARIDELVGFIREIRASERLAGKIEGLEEAAERIDKFGDRMNADGNALCDHYACKDELRRMVAELKEGK